MPGVDVIVQQGSVGDLHALDPFAGVAITDPVVWWCRPTDDAIVLGSRQTTDVLDVDACRRAGLAIVRRRSGGGAVVMRRADVVWIDAVMPTGTAPDDVRASMVWIGGLWHAVLQPRVERPLTVHDGGMQHTPWSDLVCFAGVGPGEVLIDGAKLVGLSQRRTRSGIRVQALMYRSPADDYRPILRGGLPDGEPGGQAWLDGLDGEQIAAEFARAISDSLGMTAL